MTEMARSPGMGRFPEADLRRTLFQTLRERAVTPGGTPLTHPDLRFGSLRSGLAAAFEVGKGLLADTDRSNRYLIFNEANGRCEAYTVRFSKMLFPVPRLRLDFGYAPNREILRKGDALGEQAHRFGELDAQLREFADRAPQGPEALNVPMFDLLRGARDLISTSGSGRDAAGEFQLRDRPEFVQLKADLQSDGAIRELRVLAAFGPAAHYRIQLNGDPGSWDPARHTACVARENDHWAVENVRPGRYTPCTEEDFGALRVALELLLPAVRQGS